MGSLQKKFSKTTQELKRLHSLWSLAAFVDFQAKLSLQAVTTRSLWKQLLARQRSYLRITTVQYLVDTVPIFLPQLQSISYLTGWQRVCSSSKELAWSSLCRGFVSSAAPSPDAQGSSPPLTAEEFVGCWGQNMNIVVVQKKTSKWWTCTE